MTMSTVLLMTDTWQPTVLRLVPFSSNNAKVQDKRKMKKSQSGSRNFPVLAVTRTSASSGLRSDMTSSASYFTEIPDDASVYSETTASVITTKTGLTENTTISKSRKKIPKKKVPESHSDLKEAIKFSVQDLNDQVSSSSSLQSTETKDDKSDKLKNVKLDNTRTKLPKPSMCTSPETNLCSPINGVRRSVPLTPGELELQRIRDNYYVEQVQKRKKYKLNINQLPRSTTPINDHDPDKLNMKQVIAFLQTKTPRESPSKGIKNNRKEIDASCSGKEEESPSVRNRKIVYSRDNVKSLSRQGTEIRDKVPPRTNTDTRNTDRSDSLSNTRLIPGCISVMSSKSTPNMSISEATLRSSKTRSSLSVKSYKDRPKDRKSVKQKSPKEFKLFRFLAIAPDGKTPGVATSLTESARETETTTLGQSSQNGDSRRKILQKRSRETGTAHVLHRHAKSRVSTIATKAEPKDIIEAEHKTIRLPAMVDGDTVAQDQDSDTCSTTSATCNSKTSSREDDWNHLPKKGTPITFDENIDVKITIRNFNEESQQNSSGDCSLKSYKYPEFPRVNFNGPRQIHVNVPQEPKKSYSEEIVRLTLRQDKNVTRATSYMSDIQKGISAKWHERIGNCDDEVTDSSCVISSDHNNNYDNKEWFENSRHAINNISNNNFIKVRQKLKSSNVCTGE